MKIISAGEPPLSENLGIAQIEPADQVDKDGVVMDIKLLKLALVHIQKQQPETLSIKIRKAKHSSGIDYLIFSTKKQEDGGKNEVFILSPLTTHVDQANKFTDMEDRVFLEDLAKPAQQENGGGTGNWLTNIEDVPEPKKRVRTSPAPDLEMSGETGEPVKKKRGRPKNP
jgi:hypothetical protein